MKDPVKEFIEANGIEILHEEIKASGSESLEEFLQLQHALLESFKPTQSVGFQQNIEKLSTPKRSNLEWQNFGITPGGVPQGLPIGPILAISINKEYLDQEDAVAYADDQIFFPKNVSKIIKDDPEVGIIHAQEKCG
jgi:hypothetical protein